MSISQVKARERFADMLDDAAALLHNLEILAGKRRGDPEDEDETPEEAYKAAVMLATEIYKAI